MPDQPDKNTMRIALPKGRMFDEIVSLLKGAGISIRNSERGYRPSLSLPNTDAKMLKPRNVISMLAAGARDFGFAGADWIYEMGVDIHEVLDTQLNPVQLVVAAPHEVLIDGALPKRHLVVASEYPKMAADYLIIDNTATGSTLRANGLVIIDVIMKSSTRLYASHEAMKNETKKQQIEDFAMLIDAVLQARKRVMMDLNVAKENLDAVLNCLPSMRQPTVSPLSDTGWFAS